MASCAWKKLKNNTEVKRIFRHCVTEMRLQDNHSNTDIDKSKTALNLALGKAADGYDGLCAAYDAQIARLDAQPKANKRKDRVTCISINIPCPKGMDDATARRWGQDVFAMFQKVYGVATLGAVMHFDEVHTYIDAMTKQRETSRPHLHCFFVPEINGRLNSRGFATKRSIIEMNNRVQKLTLERYPGYVFMDGTKTKRNKTVEELKNESHALEIEAKAMENAQRIEAEVRKRLAAVTEALKNAHDELQRLQDGLDRLDVTQEEAEKSKS